MEFQAKRNTKLDKFTMREIAITALRKSIYNKKKERKRERVKANMTRLT